MVTNKLTFAVFALVVLFPIYFDAIFLYTVTEAGWTFDFYSYLHFSILSKFNLLFFSILFDTPPKFDLADVKGQQRPRRALEIAAAGGHSLLLWIKSTIVCVGGRAPPGRKKRLLYVEFHWHALIL